MRNLLFMALLLMPGCQYGVKAKEGEVFEFTILRTGATVVCEFARQTSCGLTLRNCGPQKMDGYDCIKGTKVRIIRP